jgi:hypothetical protein
MVIYSQIFPLTKRINVYCSFDFKDTLVALLKCKPRPDEEKTEENKEEKPNLIAGLSQKVPYHESIHYGLIKTG